MPLQYSDIADEHIAVHELVSLRNALQIYVFFRYSQSFVGEKSLKVLFFLGIRGKCIIFAPYFIHL